ncbi:tetratricopeptide repeat protein [Geomonas propionica]|uniref:Tetratricopeptide repeat protein n=1 Tax=Geomonas propionica TaxID=2798582 RepID=A0ABS0YM43_9BACT|nr:tetratricopeptide repeat protein [Geomonas propionica]MBJ6799024.1 tetratricopeptide repeat protein [Geomonas propionica]
MIDIRSLTKSPLGIISIFVLLIEVVATTTVSIVSDKQLLMVLIGFICFYPTLITLLFFYVLMKKPQVLYGPGDFKDEEIFKSLLTNIQTLSARQEINQIDPKAPAEAFLKPIRTLLSQGDIWTAISVARSSLNEKNFEAARVIFQFLIENYQGSPDELGRIYANMAYAQIGLKDYEGAIVNLNKSKSIRGGGEENLYAWHRVALAYCYYMLGDKQRAEKIILEAKKQEGYTGAKVDFFRYYPEISHLL